LEESILRFFAKMLNNFLNSGTEKNYVLTSFPIMKPTYKVTAETESRPVLSKNGSLNLMMIYTDMTIADLEQMFEDHRSSDTKEYDPNFLHIECDELGEETNRTVCLMAPQLVDALRFSGILSRFGSMNITPYRLDSKYPRKGNSFNVEIEVPPSLKVHEAVVNIKIIVEYLSNEWKFFAGQNGEMYPPKVSFNPGSRRIEVRFDTAVHSDDIVGFFTLLNGAPWRIPTPDDFEEPPNIRISWLRTHGRPFGETFTFCRREEKKIPPKKDDHGSFSIFSRRT